MIRYIFVFIFAVFCCETSNAQLYGAQWMVGPNTSRIDFRNDTVINDSITKLMYTTGTNAAICDGSGNFLYYTNGIYVAGSNGDSLLNGNGLNPCSYTSAHAENGLPLQQAALFLPMPDNNRYFYLFHFSGDTTGGRPGTLYYSIIDKEGNNGLGEVIRKNVVFYKSLFRGGGMTACKHANGRDWWIVMAEFNSNTFYKFLLTPYGISDTLIQSIGPVYDGPFDDAYSCFSPDGSKYVTGCFVGLITVLDFDRCSGNFSNLVTINNLDDQTNSGEGPMAFSPSGRFLYVSDRVDLTQYDLWASNIQDSIEVYKADSTDNAQIDFISLAINGKIYGSTWAGGFYFLHVVNCPDALGNACGFVWGGQPTLSIDSWNLPNMPNYMLGALTGSGCDTITDVKKQTSDARPMRVQPNPADKYVYVEMEMQGNYQFELLNETGQVVATKETKQVDIFDTENLSGGVYFIKTIDKRTGKEISTKKIVVAH
jgi:hypothetical protein